LLEKNGNAVSSVTDAPPNSCSSAFKISSSARFTGLGYTRLKHTQSTRNRIWNKIDVADTKTRGLCESSIRLDRGEKFIEHRPSSQRRVARPASRITVNSPLRVRALRVFGLSIAIRIGNADTDLLRRDLLDRVCSSKMMKSLGKRNRSHALPVHPATEQDEKQGVIKHDYVGGEQTFAGLLVKAARILAAGLLSADVRFAANLRQTFGSGSTDKSLSDPSRVVLAIRQVAAIRSPRSGEKFLRALHAPRAGAGKDNFAVLSSMLLQLTGSTFLRWNVFIPIVLKMIVCVERLLFVVLERDRMPVRDKPAICLRLFLLR